MACLHPIVSVIHILYTNTRIRAYMLIFVLFSIRYEKKIQDYNFGSLIRTDAREEYSETNTIFGEFHIHIFSYIYKYPLATCINSRTL